MRDRNSRPVVVRDQSDPAPSVVVYHRGGLEITRLSDACNTVTLQLAGEMDVLAAPLLPAVAHGLKTDGVRRACLDLSRLWFCDCAGLRAFVQVHNDLAHVRGQLRIVGLRPTVGKLFAITGLDVALELDSDAAFDAFRLKVVEPSGAIRGRRL